MLPVVPQMSVEQKQVTANFANEHELELKYDLRVSR